MRRAPKSPCLRRSISMNGSGFIEYGFRLALQALTSSSCCEIQPAITGWYLREAAPAFPPHFLCISVRRSVMFCDGDDDSVLGVEAVMLTSAGIPLVAGGNLFVTTFYPVAFLAQ